MTETDRIETLLQAGLPEYRSVAFSDFESKDDGWSFEGLAAVYDSEADLGDFTEEFRRGAFRKPLANGDNTILKYEHAPPHLPALATIKGGTFEARDDVKGLRVAGTIAQHYLGDAVRVLIQRGDIRGMSPGFIVGQGNSEFSRRNGKIHRAITALKHLTDVSLTSDPAYAGTTAEMRSLWAMKMAESLEGLSQHALVGAYAQLERRAEEPAADEKTMPCEKCGADPCSCVAVDEQPDPVEVTEEEVTEIIDEPSGVATRAAARRRRLQLMGTGIPQEYSVDA